MTFTTVLAPGVRIELSGHVMATSEKAPPGPSVLARPRGLVCGRVLTESFVCGCSMASAGVEWVPLSRRRKHAIDLLPCMQCRLTSNELVAQFLLPTAPGLYVLFADGGVAYDSSFGGAASPPVRCDELQF